MKTLVVFLTLVFLSAHSHAMSFDSLIEGSKQRALSNLQKRNGTSNLVAPQLQKCADFSGSWEGECFNSTPNGDKIESLKVVLDQKKCDQLNITDGKGGEPIKTYNMGNVSSSSNAGLLLYASVREVLDWNDTGTELMLNIPLFVKVTIAGGPTFETTVRGTFKMDNQELAIDVTGPDTKQMCRLKKVN